MAIDLGPNGQKHPLRALSHASRSAWLGAFVLLIVLGAALPACQSSQPAQTRPATEGRGNESGATEAKSSSNAQGSAYEAKAPSPAAPSDINSPEPAAPAPQGTDLGKIYLQELGRPLSQDDRAFVLSSLDYYFPNQVVVLPPRALPQEAYYPPRQRYRAEKLLDVLLADTPGDAQVVVGLTAVDISTTKGPYEDWGILGLATISGRECVISRFRAAREAKSDLHTRQRLAKVVVHEIGHTLGLSHCPNHGCLMEDGKGSVLTTDHELDFCPTCRAAVGPKLLTAEGPLPWDPPAHMAEP